MDLRTNKLTKQVGIPKEDVFMGKGSLESMALWYLKAKYTNRITKNGFRGFLRKIAKKYEADDIIEHMRYQCKPDGWHVFKEKVGGYYRLVAIEIEDTSVLSKTKLEWYADLYDLMYETAWMLDVMVTDRYGLNARFLPLSEYFLASLAPKRNQAKDQPQSYLCEKCGKIHHGNCNIQWIEHG